MKKQRQPRHHQEEQGKTKLINWVLLFETNENLQNQ
jgi:hypothetical protein